MNFLKLCKLYENASPIEDDNDGSQIFLAKILQLLKNDEVFVDQVKAVVNGFRKNRYQVTPYQENILKTLPKKVDILWGIINRLTKIVNDPKKQKQLDYYKFVDDLNDAVSAKNEGEDLLDNTTKEIEDVVKKNERMNDEYIEQLFVIIKHSANRIIDNLLQNTASDIQFNPIDPSDWKMAAKLMSKDLSFQIEALENILSEDETLNPFLVYFKTKQDLYNTAKERYDMMKKDRNYRSSVDQLYSNLPMAAFFTEFYTNLTKQAKILSGKNLSKRQQIVNALNGIKNEVEFQNIVPELEEYLKNSKLDADKKLNIQKIMAGPFISRKGSPNAASKIRKIMNSKTIEENFDKYFDFMLEQSNLNEFDEDDMKLDFMEVASLLEETSKKCTGPTKRP